MLAKIISKTAKIYVIIMVKGW